MTVNGMGGYVSADGHVVEPADLWTTRMDKRFRDRAPHVDSRPDADYYIIDGLSPFPVGLEGASMEDKIAGEIVERVYLSKKATLFQLRQVRHTLSYSYYLMTGNAKENWPEVKRQWDSFDLAALPQPRRTLKAVKV